MTELITMSYTGGGLTRAARANDFPKARSTIVQQSKVGNLDRPELMPSGSTRKVGDFVVTSVIFTEQHND